MKWIRGGTWRVVPVETASVRIYCARLEPEIGLRPKHHLEVRRAASDFLRRPNRWVNQIGKPAGLEVYEMTMPLALKLLEDMRSLSADFQWELDARPLEDMLPERGEQLVERLLKMLAEHGPLWAVKGVVDLGVGFPYETDKGMFREVDLDAFAAEIHAFAQVFEEVMRRKTNDDERRRLAEWMRSASSPDLREVGVLVEVSTSYGVRFEARPLTLRAYLWQALFEIHQRNLGICRHCGEGFNVPQKRGRPFRYCDKCRGSKFRTAVLEGRQPYRFDTGDR